MTSVLLYILLLVSEHHGQVIFNGVPVPGATVTVEQADKTFTAITDSDGLYSFSQLADGSFAIQVEMLGFSTIKQDVNVPSAVFELKMLPVEEIHAQVAHGSIVEQRAEVKVSTNPAPETQKKTETPPPQSSAFANLSQDDLNQRAADGLLINGNVNNGAASPFAQLAAFGNNRRTRSLYNGSAGVVIDTSALDARSYSLTGQNTPKPSFNHFTGAFNFGGPLKLPHWTLNNAPTFYVGYQRVQNRNANTVPGRMPTEVERSGEFSSIPQDRISAQARALMNLFPLPNFLQGEGYNYQVALIDTTHQDGLQARLSKVLNPRNQLAGSLDMQSVRSDNTNLFNFRDGTQTFGLSAAAQWTTRPSPRFSATFRYQFGRQSTRVTPYFANRINVAGVAGIAGNNQEAIYWGPPTLTFSGGITSLTDGQYSFNRTQNSTASYSSFWNHGRHNATFGADIRRQQFNVLSQQDPRGTFIFTGAATGSDFGRFLLGIPDTTSIAFGNADKYFRQTFYDGFAQDDWRMNASLTVNLGVRWEYETPVAETRGRLVNLNIAHDFSTVAPLIGNDLVHSDAFGIQPRVSFAWRPIAASSLIVRGAYGVYRNTNVYQAIATQMAQQAPLSKSLSVQNTPANPLTLANGFVVSQGVTPNTFAVDPDFRVGYVQTWTASIQRDLPAALQMTVMYTGTKGTRLPQEVVPNTFPAGAVSPTGYVYLSSNGNSTRNAAQFQLRRRLRSGFTATTQYTYSKAFDNAPLLSGLSGGIVTASQGGSAIAQNWLDLRAERAPSSFDQRNQLSVQMQYTTGVGARGGSLVGGWKGVLFKEWTVASTLNMGSGFPETPIYFAAVRGTGVTGNLRPDVTGASIDAAPSGLFLNPAAFRIPAPGTWGDAGRNSIRGPSQFVFNASLGRTFPWRDRYSIDLRVDATNMLNHVTFKAWNTTITNAQFGLPSAPNPMRSLQTSLRLRF
jgi:trimeric autotransporter adhesin